MSRRCWSTFPSRSPAPIPRGEALRRCREIEALSLEAIAAARKILYIENQYFDSPKIGDAIEARLRDSDGRKSS